MKHWRKALLTSVKGVENLVSRLMLRNRSVSIVSNDCWGGRMYQAMHLPFNGPFVGLFIVGPDFITLLENIGMLRLPLQFIPLEESRYIDYLRSVDQTTHPVGLLEDEDKRVEIHFLHYPDAATAKEKWERRLKRLDLDNAIVKFSDRDICDESLLERFDRLPYRQKVAFTAFPHPGLKSCVCLPGYREQGRVSLCWNISNFYWSFARHANRLKP